MPIGMSSISAISSNGRPRCTCSTTTVRCARESFVNPRSIRSRSNDCVECRDRRVVGKQAKGDYRPAAVRFGVTRIDHEPIRPRVEPLRVPERRQLAPGDGQCLLRGVLGERRVAKDPVGDGDKAVDGRGHESGKRLLVTSLCSSHQVGLHRPPLGREAVIDPPAEYERRRTPIRSTRRKFPRAWSGWWSTVRRAVERLTRIRPRAC